VHIDNLRGGFMYDWEKELGVLFHHVQSAELGQSLKKKMEIMVVL